MYAAALHDEAWSGAVNACSPDPVTNAGFSRALGRALKRPTVLPVPGIALRLLYGEMASVVTASQRMVPRRARELGYEFAHPELDGALRAALG
jgi:NAD dependent epimerase/dehydratase family enzyme